ncbi:MAG: hypothetical protein ACOYNN_18835 [Terrimicrobiaceae bacterium]
MEFSVQVTVVQDDVEVTKVTSITVPVGNLPSDLSTIAPGMFSQLFAAIDASEGDDEDDDEEGDE